MENLKEQIYERVEKMYHQGVGISRLQATLVRVFQQEVPMELIRDIIKEVKEGQKQIGEISEMIKDIPGRDEPDSKKKEREDGGLKDIVADMGDDKKYDYFPETGHLVIYPEGVKKSLLLSTLEAIIEDYSKDGGNLSSKQIQIKYQLTPKVRIYLKNTFNIYKDSTPFDPITLQSFQSEEDMEKEAKSKAERLTEGKMKRIYDDAVRRTESTVFRKTSKIAIGLENQLDAILMEMKKRKPISFGEITPQKINKNKKTKQIFITDAHLGKKDTDGIVIRFKKLTRELVECEESNIDITFGGDLGEQFVARGEKHPGSRLGMENINLEDLFSLILDVFEEMLLAIYKSGKTLTFNGLGGNHDSFESNKDFDPLRSPAMIIYRLLQKLTKDTNIKINILRETLNIVKKGHFKFLYAHGDKKGLERVRRAALNHIEDGYYLIIVTGDKHHSETHEISDRVTWVQSRALAGPGKYDGDLQMTSQPGLLEFIENEDGLVDILIKSYK